MLASGKGKQITQEQENNRANKGHTSLSCMVAQIVIISASYCEQPDFFFDFFIFGYCDTNNHRGNKTPQALTYLQVLQAV